MAKHAHNTPPSTPVSRRALALGAGALSAIGITAGAAASVPEVAGPHPDAELLALCAEAALADDRCMDAWRRSEALASGDPRRREVNEESDHYFVRFNDLFDRAAAIPARTVEGMRAQLDLVLRDMVFAPAEEDTALTFMNLRKIAGRA